MFGNLKDVEPKKVHVSHNCPVFRKIYSIGDRVNVSAYVAYSISEGGYENGRIETEIISGMATVIERSSKGRLLVVFDDKEYAAHFAEMQRENKIGFYGKLEKGIYIDEFEDLSKKGFPFWVWPKDIRK